MLGHSGGRSAGHPEGQGAVRRNTPRERDLTDPPWDQVVPRFPKFMARTFGWPVIFIALGLGLGLGIFAGVLIGIEVVAR